MEELISKAIKVSNTEELLAFWLYFRGTCFPTLEFVDISDDARTYKDTTYDVDYVNDIGEIGNREEQLTFNKYKISIVRCWGDVAYLVGGVEKYSVPQPD